MDNRLLYTISLSFALGIFMGSLLPVGYTGALLVVLLGGAVMLVSKKKLLFFGALALALGIILVLVRTTDPTDLALESRVGEDVSLVGVITEEPVHKERSQQLVLTPEGDSAGRILLIAPPRPRYGYGDVVVVSGELTKPEAFTTDTGRTFDYARFLAKNDVFYQIFFPEITSTEEQGGNIVRRGLFALKEMFLSGLNKTLPQPHGALAGGLIVGAQEALGDNLLDAFRATGIIHIVVLSGYNVAIVAEAIMRLTKRFLAPKVALTLGAVSIVLFAILTGASATIVRASLMALLVLLARATGRTYDILRALIIAGVVMLVHNPHILVFDPSFQLSFLATLGLIFFAPHIEQLLRHIPGKWGIREFTTATIATQLFVLPLLLFSMGEISLVAIPVNVLILGLVPLTMLAGFIVGTLGIVSSVIALPFTALATAFLGYILSIVDVFARIPFATILVPSFPFWALVLVYGVYGFLLWRLHDKTKTRAASTERVSV